MPKFIIRADKQNQHRVRLEADNGETIFITEGYSSRSAAHHAINIMKLSIMANVINSAPPPPPTILTSTAIGMDRIYCWNAGESSGEKGKWRVEYIASNGKTICWTEKYVNLTDASKAINLLQKSADYPIE